MSDKKNAIRVDGVFDLETSEWDKFAVGGYYDAANGFTYSFDSDEFFDFLLDRGGHLWAWNGGLFDFLWFLDIAAKRGIKAFLSAAGTRITRIEIGKLVLRDACALVPSSLGDAAPIGGMELSKETGLQCRCGEDCGGYCSITPNCGGMAPGEKQSLIDYLELDCVATWRILDAIFAHAHNHDYVLKGTLGGSAWATAQKRLGLENAQWGEKYGPQSYRWAREGYYGGRVTVARVVADKGYRYDINSAYPAALSNLSIPTGAMYRFGGRRATLAYCHGKDGVYKATVSVPRDCHTPPLPLRTPRGRVCFPIGRFFGSWTGYELRAAERYGVKIEQIHTAIAWSDSYPVFAEFMREVFAVRASVGKSTPLGKWQKLFGNSLTGKFAQNPEGLRMVLNPAPDDIKLCPGGDCGGDKGHCSRIRGRCCTHHCSGACRSWRQVDAWGRIWGMPTWRLPNCGYVHWAAYLTAWARITWLGMASQFGDKLLYGDTDSVYSMVPANNDSDIGPNLGQWGYDGEMRHFEAIGPKAYRYFDPAKNEWTTRLKGVPNISNEEWKRFRDGRLIESRRGVMGLRSSAKRLQSKDDTIFKRKVIKRSDKSDGLWYGDRILRRNSTITDPVTYGQQCKRDR